MNMKKSHIIVLSVFAFVFLANTISYHYSSRYRNFLFINIEDAYISMRYAENFSNGHGLKWNVDERPVEGYTNFLWVLLLSLAGKLGTDMVLWSKILGIASALVGIALAYLAANEFDYGGEDGLAGLMAAFVLCFNPSYVFWAGSGMESSLFATLILLSLFLYFRESESSARYIAISITLALASLTRPEGLLFFGLLFVHFCFWRLFRPKRLDVKLLLSILVPFCLFIVPYLMWRNAYYGFLLPNTFYAKTGENNPGIPGGLAYLADYLKANPWSVGLLLTAPFFAKNKARLSFVYLCVTAFTCYVVVIGGDFMPLHRFFLPILPWFAVCFALLVCGLVNHLLTEERTSARRLALISAAFAVVFMLNSRTLYTSSHRISYDIKQENSMLVVIGRQLRAYYPPDTEMAIWPAGAIAYYSGFKAIDMLGLNDLHIAHLKKSNLGELDLENSSFPPILGLPGHCKTDIPYVMDRKPTLLIGIPDLTLHPDVPSKWDVEELFKGYDRSEYELAVDKLISPGDPFYDHGIYLRYLRRIPRP